MLSSVRAPRSRQGHADGLELLRELATHTDTHAEASPGMGIEVGQLLRHHDRVVQRKHEDSRPDLDPFGPRRHQGEPGDGLARGARGEEMSALPHRIDRELLDRPQPLPVGLGQHGCPEGEATVVRHPARAYRRIWTTVRTPSAPPASSSAASPSLMSSSPMRFETSEPRFS